MAKKLKVGFVFDDSLDRNDGVQQYVKTVGRWLIKQGHEVRFLVGETHNAGDVHDHVYSMSKNITVKGNQNTLSIPRPASRSYIAEVLEKERFDVLHVQVPYNPMLAGRVIAATPQETAVVGTFHIVGATRWERLGCRLLSIAQRRTLARFDAMYAVSPAAQIFARASFGLQTEVSPNVVELSRFKGGVSRPELRGAKGTIVFLGRLVERKGAQHLIEALGGIPRKQLDGVLVHMCGDGELRRQLEARVNSLGLSDTVRFHGFITEEEKPDYLASADIAVFPATGGESFGIVLIEAMAAGDAAVLGGNNPGYATVLTDKRHLFAPADTRQFAGMLARLLRDPRARKSMADWQHERVKDFDIGLVGPQLVDHYEKAIISRRASSLDKP